jgi:PTH2 family peptidyl-tRNA hydrolase
MQVLKDMFNHNKIIPSSGHQSFFSKLLNNPLYINILMPEYKQVILVRSDLKLPPGKLAAQVAHASVEAVLRSDKEHIQVWHNQGMKKVVLKVATLKGMKKYMQMAKDAGLVTALITDAGKTVVEPGTQTCCAIGPDNSDDIDAITSDLKMV